MAYIDIKVTAWERYYFSDDVEVEDIKSIDDVRNLLDYYEEYELLLETIEELSPEKNQGSPTIEVYDDEGELIYSN